MIGLTLNGLKYTKSSISIPPKVVHVTMINNIYFIFIILENVDEKNVDKSKLTISHNKLLIQSNITPVKDPTPVVPSLR